ncbi:MAG: hypothetical protein ACFB9M_02875 [Myxococcota bacterium]
MATGTMNPNVPFLFLKSGLTYVTAVVLGLAVADARASESDRHALSGVWEYDGDGPQEEARKQAVESATKDMSRLVRGKARRRLDARTTPPRKLKIDLEDNRLQISRDGGSVSLELGAEPVVVEKDGTQGALSARLDGEELVVVSEAEKAKRITTYALTPDHDQLTVSVHMTGERLPAPLNYETTYRRE